MNKKFLIGCIVIFIAVVLIGVAIFFGVLVNIRNNMTQKNVKVDQEWSQVQNVYQRRIDLVPNLAEAAKAYLKLEKDIFKSIADARAGVAAAKNPADLENATTEINSFIRDFRVVVEDTPELKASETIRDLMNQLEGTENRITVERQRFNGAVGDYNTYIKLWPQSIIASRYGFEPRAFFEAEAGAEKAPDINLNIDETTTQSK
ncbi:MAG: LemA family protein [Actinobacteria bacterium]|nr:LemA family protein [Actinomycetota bacterium]